MPKKTIADSSIPLRPVIRETLGLSKRKLTIRALHALIRADFTDATEADVKAALLWNQMKGFADYAHNSEFGHDEWHLTDRGRAAA